MADFGELFSGDFSLFGECDSDDDLNNKNSNKDDQKNAAKNDKYASSKHDKKHNVEKQSTQYNKDIRNANQKAREEYRKLSKGSSFSGDSNESNSALYNAASQHDNFNNNPSIPVPTERKIPRNKGRNGEPKDVTHGFITTKLSPSEHKKQKWRDHKSQRRADKLARRQNLDDHQNRLNRKDFQTMYFGHLKDDDEEGQSKREQTFDQLMQFPRESEHGNTEYFFFHF